MDHGFLADPILRIPSKSKAVILFPLKLEKRGYTRGDHGSAPSLAAKAGIADRKIITYSVAPKGAMTRTPASANPLRTAEHPLPGRTDEVPLRREIMPIIRSSIRR
jgi:hypothetical protein